MSTLPHLTKIDHVTVAHPNGASPVVLVCEHASSFIPPEFDNLGLPERALQSHIAWDPGALAVAQAVSEHLDAVLVSAGVSRLIYDCNRPPNAAAAMPAQSEDKPVPGNAALDQAERAARTARVYIPFRDRLARVIAAKPTAVIVTIHSFTPVFHGVRRAVEIGILHDSDARLADAMLDIASSHTTAQIRRNDPYGPQDGVTHTLREHALPHGHLNVMIELRNDLIANSDQQADMAAMLSRWLADACARAGAAEAVLCRV